MANQEHLEILRHGMDQWNQWRTFDHQGHPRFYLNRIEPDLSGWEGIFLREFDFHQRFLPQYIPHPSELRELHEAFANGSLDIDLLQYGWKFLDDIDLSFANLSQSNLTRLTLRRARMFRADLSGATLNLATFDSADLRECNLTAATLEKARLVGVNLSGTN